MTCENCGSVIKEGADFCDKCGAPVKKNETNPESPAAVESTQKKQKKHKDSKRELRFSSGVESAARGALSSAWLLAGTVFLCLQTVLMIIYTFFGEVDEVLNFLGRLFFFQDRALLYLRIAVAAAAAIEIIMIIGFTLTFISAARRKNRFKTAGLSILQVLCAAGLIIFCFLGLCAIGAALVGIRYLRHYYFISLEGVTTGQIVYVACMLSALIICYVLVLIFLVKLVSSIGRVKRAASEGIARKNIAFYNVVALCAVAVCIVAFAVASLLTSAPSVPIIIIGELSLAASCVFYALFMIKYRKDMKENL